MIWQINMFGPLAIFHHGNADNHIICKYDGLAVPDLQNKITSDIVGP